MTNTPHYPREDRKEQIVGNMLRNGANMDFTMLEVSRMVGMAKSAHLRGLLEELALERVINVHVIWSNRYRCEVVYYRIDADWLKENVDTFPREMQQSIMYQLGLEWTE